MKRGPLKFPHAFGVRSRRIFEVETIVRNEGLRLCTIQNVEADVHVYI